jgi:hypothetical protein
MRRIVVLFNELDREIWPNWLYFNDKRSELAEEAENSRKMSLEHCREKTIQTAGPMAIWDVFAQKLEDLVEIVRLRIV